MNTVEFAKRIQTQEKLTGEEKERIIKQSINWDGATLKYIVAVEELSELQKEITKQLRDESEYMNFLEELADVYICLEYLKAINKVDEDILDKAISVKLERDHNRVIDELTYRKRITQGDLRW